MQKRFSVNLEIPAHDMAQEEIGKQVAFLSKNVQGVRFFDGGKSFDFEAPEEVGAALVSQARDLALRVQRSLRTLERKMVFRSSRIDHPTFSQDAASGGIHQMGVGQVALTGVPLKLFRYFDRIFEQFGRPWNPEPLLTPTLIPSRVLAKCDYFRSFPHNVTFAAHLSENASQIADFRARHQNRDDLDESALKDMDVPEACLSPAVCYHVYHLNRDRVIPGNGLIYEICGKCFRYESSNITDLRRLWDFTMREIVFLGARENVLQERERSIEMMKKVLEDLELAGEIRTASDPFFVAPDAMAKTYFQLSSETKYEISLALPEGARVAVGSHNYHSDFFGRAFNTQVEGGGAMQSVCVAFGLERWVHAFLAQHGSRVERWPTVVRQAPEFQ